MNDIKQGEIKISGLSDLEKNMVELPDRIAKNVLDGGLRAAANVIRDDARRRAQSIINTEHRFFKKTFHGQDVLLFPGFTVRKIAAWKKRRTPWASTFNIGVAGYKQRFSKYFAFWWRFFEFGTSKMAAKPFLRPAFEAHKTDAVNKMKLYMGGRIEKEAQRKSSKYGGSESIYERFKNW